MRCFYDVTKAAVQEAIIDLGGAFRASFARRGRYPRFKRKDDCQSFCAANEAGTSRVDGERIQLPWLARCGCAAVRFTGQLKYATVCREAGRWFVSIMVETDDVKPGVHSKTVVGADLGVSALAAISTGDVIDGPKAHAAALKRLRRANKALARKLHAPAKARRHTGANIRKAKARVAKVGNGMPAPGKPQPATPYAATLTGDTNRTITDSQDAT